MGLFSSPFLIGGETHNTPETPTGLLGGVGVLITGGCHILNKDIYEGLFPSVPLLLYLPECSA